MRVNLSMSIVRNGFPAVKFILLVAVCFCVAIGLNGFVNIKAIELSTGKMWNRLIWYGFVYEEKEIAGPLYTSEDLSGLRVVAGKKLFSSRYVSGEWGGVVAALNQVRVAAELLGIPREDMSLVYENYVKRYDDFMYGVIMVDVQEGLLIVDYGIPLSEEVLYRKN